MEAPSPARRIGSFVLESPRAIVLVVAVYVACGAVFLRTDHVLNDEGLATVNWATWAHEAFLPVFFFQKAKPVLAALYLPAALLGPRACLAAHLLVAATAIPMMAATARALGLAFPNLAALVVALSPIHFLGGASGVSNTDGVVVTVLALYLLVARRNELLAGIVLGLSPWVRHELALLVAVLVVRAVVDRSWRTIAGVAVFPALYAAAGALYHHDPLWIIHYPPTTAQPMPDNPVWEPVTARATLLTVLGVTPIALFAFGVRSTRLSSLERWLRAYAILWLLLVTVLPVWRIANFGFVPRYALTVLPVVALLGARAAEAWADGERPTVVDFALTAGLVVLWGLSEFREASAFGAVALAAMVVLGAAEIGRGRLAALLAAALAIVTPVLPLKTEIRRSELGWYLPEMTDWLAQHVGGDTRVYTNSPLLALWARGAGRLPGLDVRYLVGVDQYFDLVEMGDAHNGQRDALERLATRDFDGTRGVLPVGFSPEKVEEPAVFVLRRDQRADLVLPPSVWKGRLEPLHDGLFRAFRFVR